MLVRALFVIGLLVGLQGNLLAAKKPNIIVIYTDDQGFGDASCLDTKAKFQTPDWIVWPKRNRFHQRA